MKYCFGLTIILLTYVTGLYAQDADYALIARDERVQSVNTDNLLTLRPGKSCVLVKFWIPNCPTAVKQFKEFVDFEKTVSFPVLFVGITNIPQKITDIADQLHYKGALYMLDTTISSDIYKRFNLFRADLSKRYHQKTSDYFLFMFDKNKQLILANDALDFPAYLKAKCK